MSAPTNAIQIFEEFHKFKKDKIYFTIYHNRVPIEKLVEELI